MTEETPKSYGKVTATDSMTGFPTIELDVVSFVQADFVEGRHLSVAKLSDGTYVLSVENPISTGRNPQQTMRLSEESLYSLYSTMAIYFSCTGIDMMELARKAIGGSEISYSTSDNLQKFGNEPVKEA